MPVKKIPTDDEYHSYDGAHCFHLWDALDDTWRCPGCGRSRREVLRWTKRQAKPWKGIHQPYWGWLAGLHVHHDHSSPYGFGGGRFPDTVLCDQCNAADGQAKKGLKLPANFSFSPSEIREFVTATPHDRHRVDLEKAKVVYE